MTNEDLPFQSVHDSYWTTASNVARMNYLLRKAFVEMYQHEYPEQMVDLMEFYFSKSNLILISQQVISQQIKVLAISI